VVVKLQPFLVTGVTQVVALQQFLIGVLPVSSHCTWQRPPSQETPF